MAEILCAHVWKGKNSGTILRIGEGEKGNDGGVNLISIHGKHFCKCQNVLPVQQ
jgi:hypothetical protein